jgi:hypothetical protein
VFDTVKVFHRADRGLTLATGWWAPVNPHVPIQYARLLGLIDPRPTGPRHPPSDPLFEIARVTYSLGEQVVCVETSLPMVLYGHNARLIREAALPFVYDELDGLVGRGFVNARLPSVREWIVRRADAVFDFRSRRFPFVAVREALVNLQPTGGRIANRFANETAYFRTRSRRKRVEIAIYDKRAQIRSGAQQGGAACARDVMRIEVRLVGQEAVRKAFKLRSPPHLCDITSGQAARSVIVGKLRSLNVAPGMESIIVGFDSLAARVGHRRARQLWPFAQEAARATLADACARLGLSVETGRRYVRELRKAGLYPAAVATAGILEEVLAQLTEGGGQAATAASGATVSPPAAEVATR